MKTEYVAKNFIAIWSTDEQRASMMADAALHVGHSEPGMHRIGAFVLNDDLRNYRSIHVDAKHPVASFLIWSMWTLLQREGVGNFTSDAREQSALLQTARNHFLSFALEVEDKSTILKEVSQLLVDMMDVLQQSDEEMPILEAHRALSSEASKLGIKVP